MTARDIDEYTEILIDKNVGFYLHFKAAAKLKRSSEVKKWGEISQTEKWPSQIVQPTLFKPSSPRNAPFFKEEMTINELYELLLEELQKQHQKTRLTMKEESMKLRKDLIDYIRGNPIATVDLFSKIVLICALFTLAVWGISGFSIINPLFSIFLIVFSGTGIALARIKRAMSKGSE